MGEDYETYGTYPWSPFPLSRAHPGPGPHICEGACMEAVLALLKHPLQVSYARTETSSDSKNKPAA